MPTTKKELLDFIKSYPDDMPVVITTPSGFYDLEAEEINLLTLEEAGEDSFSEYHIHKHNDSEGPGETTLQAIVIGDPY